MKHLQHMNLSYRTNHKTNNLYMPQNRRHPYNIRYTSGFRNYCYTNKSHLIWHMPGYKIVMPKYFECWCTRCNYHCPVNTPNYMTNMFCRLMYMPNTHCAQSTYKI